MCEKLKERLQALSTDQIKALSNKVMDKLGVTRDDVFEAWGKAVAEVANMARDHGINVVDEAISHIPALAATNLMAIVQARRFIAEDEKYGPATQAGVGISPPRQDNTENKAEDAINV